MDAIQFIKNDHQLLEALFKRFERGRDDRKLKKGVVDEIISLLSRHAVIEEQLLYPMYRRNVEDGEGLVLQSLEEHHAAKVVLEELTGLKPDHERFDAKVAVLIEVVRPHIQKEERVMLPKLQKTLEANALNQLGEALDAAKRVAPTRPHPRAPDTPPGNLVAGTMASVVDRGRDVLKGLGMSTGRRQIRQEAARTAKQVTESAKRVRASVSPRQAKAEKKPKSGAQKSRSKAKTKSRSKR